MQLIVTCAGCGAKYRGESSPKKFRCAACSNLFTFPEKAMTPPTEQSDQGRTQAFELLAELKKEIEPEMQGMVDSMQKSQDEPPTRQSGVVATPVSASGSFVKPAPSGTFTSGQVVEQNRGASG